MELNETYVNKNAIIRFRSKDFKTNRLSTYKKFREEVGEELGDKLLQKFFDSGKDKLTRHLRRGITVDIVAR